MSMRIPKNNYCPVDTFRIFNSLNQFSKNNNFYYLFNIPQIIGTLPEKIRINEEIEKYKWDEIFLKNIILRKQKTIEHLESASFHKRIFNAICPWRLVIGLGASHPQETSMTLHHIYGIPYIPGSAVKGVTRHWTILKFADFCKEHLDKEFENCVKELSSALEQGRKIDSLEIEGIKFNDLIDIFGTQKQAGKVIFMDAYPVDEVNLKIDIMNAHYPDYYSKARVPADWQTPNPIKFLTVENTKFSFSLLSHEEEFLNKTYTLLKGALSDHGVGAKTSLGYGVFKNFDEL